jgi:hypothetical protein
VTGAVSRLVVLDFDGEEGRRSLDRLNLKPHIQTGSGGAHVYFAHPGALVRTLNSKTTKRIQDNYSGVDVRADGGYAIFCGRSIHGPYLQRRDVADVEPWERIPFDLRAMIAAPTSLGSRTDRTELFLQDALTRAAVNGRNDTGFWLACQLRDSDLTKSEAEPVMRRYQQDVGPFDRHGKEEAYAWQEAANSLRQAYAAPKRERATRPGAAACGNVSAESSEQASPASSPLEIDLPPGYEMTSQGLFHIPSATKPPIKLCDPFEVPFMTHDARGEDPGKLVRFKDRFGKPHELHLTDAQLVAERGEWRQALARSGSRMAPGRSEAPLLRDCLYLMEAQGRATRVDQIGWHRDVYVTPSYQVPDSIQERFIHDDATGREYHFGKQGTLSDWREGVSRLCMSNPLLLFAVSGAFAPILLRLKSGLGGGFHFGGGTSTGKTTSLTVASSVWGNPKPCNLSACRWHTRPGCRNR